jgi:hypothetical protein
MSEHSTLPAGSDGPGFLVTRRRSLAIAAGSLFGFVVTLKELAAPHIARAYVTCECQNFAPYFYRCIDGTLYMIGVYVDCHNFQIECSGLIGIPIACC